MGTALLCPVVNMRMKNWTYLRYCTWSHRLWIFKTQDCK